MFAIKSGVIISGSFIVAFGVVCNSVLLIGIGLAACISVLFYDD